MSIELPNGYVAVTAPDWVGDIREEYQSVLGSSLIFHKCGKKVTVARFTSSPEAYKLIGRADELTEEQCKSVVGDSKYCWICGFPHFHDYHHGYYYIYMTAKGSFNSLLASLNLKPDTTVIIKKEK